MRLAHLLVGVSVAALAQATPASTKEGARARLASELPLGAPPARTVRVAWTVDVPDGRAGRRPFGACGMFVRLLSRTGAPSTHAFAGGRRCGADDGRYAAAARVPAGGIGGVRFGLRGTTDIYFPLENDPFTTTSGVRCDVGAVRATLGAFVRAYNQGDLRRLDRLFSRERPVRHRTGERLRLAGYRFNGRDRRDLGHFDVVLRRRAIASRDGRWLQIVGKGALDCSRTPTRIAVLRLGARQ
jgi:hypothetical protein